MKIHTVSSLYPQGFVSWKPQQIRNLQRGNCWFYATPPPVWNCPASMAAAMPKWWLLDSVGAEATIGVSLGNALVFAQAHCWEDLCWAAPTWRGSYNSVAEVPSIPTPPAYLILPSSLPRPTLNHSNELHRLLASSALWSPAAVSVLYGTFTTPAGGTGILPAMTGLGLSSQSGM